MDCPKSTKARTVIIAVKIEEESRIKTMKDA